MFRKRHVRAALFLSVLWGGIHSIASVLWGVWDFTHWDSHPLGALPGWLTMTALHGGRAGILAGLVFALLLYRFERSRMVGNLSTPRVAVWGILSSLPAYFAAEGLFPLLLRGGAPWHSLAAPVPYFVTVGALAAITTMAFARRGSGDDDAQASLRAPPETLQLNSGRWWGRIRSRGFSARADSRCAIPSTEALAGEAYLQTRIPLG